MANRYVFNIDEIISVKVISKSDGYTTNYNRKLDDNYNPSMYFVQSYFAPEDRSSNDGTVKVICPRCEGWNTFKVEEFDSDDFEYECKFCEDDYEDYVEESEMIDFLLSIMDPETYNDIQLFINDIAIV